MHPLSFPANRALTYFLPQYIQRDFVRDRQQNQAITSDDLIRRMTVAK